MVHNYYGLAAPSGENTVFEAERDLLAGHGHSLREFTVRSDRLRRAGAWGAVAAACEAPCNPIAAFRLHRALERHRSEVAHVHNTFPRFSPAVLYGNAGLPCATVMTLHNYRLRCANATLFRANRPCVECLESQSVRPGLLHGCYKSSRAATLPLAALIALHWALPTWRRVNAFITLTEAQKDVLVKAGLPEQTVHVKPHFIDCGPPPVPWPRRENRIIFAGGLFPHKGLGVLVEALARSRAFPPPQLDVIGGGPEHERMVVHAAALNLGERVRFLGMLTPDQVRERISTAKLLVMPSLGAESFGMVLLEAFSRGVPVLASRLPAVATVVRHGKEGFLFPPGDPDALATALDQLWADPGRLETMGFEARAAAQNRFSPSVNHDRLMEIYESALASRRMQRES